MLNMFVTVIFFNLFSDQDDNQDEEEDEQADGGSQEDEESRGSNGDRSASESGSESGEETNSADDNSEHSGSDSEQEDDEVDQNIDDEPLHAGARVTFRESLLAILCFALKHKLTGVCVADLLSLIELHCGADSIALKTLYKFKKYFSMIGKQNINCHYFCSGCEVSLATENSVCQQCDGRHRVAHFIGFPIMTQLQSMYSRPGFKESLQFKANRVKKNANNIEDIYDGAIYQEQVTNGFLANPNNISFFMYFDGVAIFKNSKFSIWPIFLSINELNYKERVKKENVVLAGLWFGKSKPNTNLFLSPLLEKMSDFENNGVEFQLPNDQRILVKGKILGAVADLPAKAQFMRIVQYNGLHSCSNCMSSGGRLDVGDSTVQVFPYSRDFELRNNGDMVNFANLAYIARQQDPEATVYGVKGPTLLFSLLPNMINCMGIDVMHGVSLGIMRTVTELWFSSKHTGSPFSIADHVNIVDARLMRIKPPQNCQKMPRSIKKELALFKAADYKLFLLTYSLPVLLGILPAVYWEHHCKLVSAISLLSQESVSHEQIDVAEELLHNYVKDFEQLYGLRYLGLNLHQLLHLCLVVRNLGPLWVYSCFFYESLNGDLSRLVHGTRYAALQISAAFNVHMNLPIMINIMADSEAKLLCLKFLSSGNKVKITELIDDKTGVVGKYKKCDPVPERISRLLQDEFNANGGICKYFFRLRRKGVVYSSETYLRSKRKLTCYVEILHEGSPYLCKIKSFVKWSACNENCPPICNDCRNCFFCIVTVHERVLWELHDKDYDIAHLCKVVPSNDHRVFSVETISKACFYLPIDENEYIVLPVNTLEIE